MSFGRGQRLHPLKLENPDACSPSCPWVRSLGCREVGAEKQATLVTETVAKRLRKAEPSVSDPQGSAAVPQGPWIGALSQGGPQPGSVDLLKTPKTTQTYSGKFLGHLSQNWFWLLPRKNPNWYSFLSIISNSTCLKLNSGLFPLEPVIYWNSSFQWHHSLHRLAWTCRTAPPWACCPAPPCHQVQFGCSMMIPSSSVSSCYFYGHDPVLLSWSNFIQGHPQAPHSALTAGPAVSFSTFHFLGLSLKMPTRLFSLF